MLYSTVKPFQVALVKPVAYLNSSYQKIHLLTYQSQEAKILTPGVSIAVIPTELGNFGLATCYDLRFPDLFRTMIDLGAEFFLISSAWPYPRLEHWLLLNRTRASTGEQRLSVTAWSWIQWVKSSLEVAMRNVLFGQR